MRGNGSIGALKWSVWGGEMGGEKWGGMGCSGAEKLKALGGGGEDCESCSEGKWEQSAQPRWGGVGWSQRWLFVPMALGTGPKSQQGEGSPILHGLGAPGLVVMVVVVMGGHSLPCPPPPSSSLPPRRSFASLPPRRSSGPVCSPLASCPPGEGTEDCQRYASGRSGGDSVTPCTTEPEGRPSGPPHPSVRPSPPPRTDGRTGRGGVGNAGRNAENHPTLGHTGGGAARFFED